MNITDKMAPPNASSRVVSTVKRTPQVLGGTWGKTSKPTETTSNSNPSLAVTEKSDPELVRDFRSDLQGIRNLVTCTICDQLLYEPWTLLCGHTYCYSCLCSWFLPNRRKKTCPDCRDIVRHMPAPSFVIKQMVEILINRAELMPIDETSDQHRERKTSENNIVETDKASELGLFKGCFSKQPLGYLQYNEEDRIYRCSRCAHEYIGGGECENCGIDFDEEEDIDVDGFSDVDADLSIDEFGYHVDLDAESDDDEDDSEDVDGLAHSSVPYFGERGSPLFIPLEASTPAWTIPGTRRDRSGAGASSNSENSEDEEETESMRDFIEDDGERYEGPGSYHSSESASDGSISSRGPENESVVEDDDNDDENESSDDGGPVPSGRRRHRAAWAGAIGTCPAPRASESASTSEAGDLTEESRRLQDSGWSPLEQEPEGSYGEHLAFVPHDGSVSSDTDTTVVNQESEDEDEDGQDDNGSATPVWERGSRFYRGGHSQSERSQSTENRTDGEGYDSDVHETNFTDREGDVEMSVSPVSSRRTSTASEIAERGTRRSVEILGPASNIHEIEDDSSDGTVQPANRRRRVPRYFRQSHTANYDPRISMMFAQHQLDLRDATARQSPYFEPASRSRPVSSYRLMPAWGSALSHHPYASPAVILTSVSNWPNRVQRQYHRRYFN